MYMYIYIYMYGYVYTWYLLDLCPLYVNVQHSKYEIQVLHGIYMLPLISKLGRHRQGVLL